jgi:hypothetical protein
MGPEHVNDALGEISRQLLALGARLIYGGDLRAGGVTEMLFELAARYSPPLAHRDEQTAMIIDVLAYPMHAELTSEDLLGWESDFAMTGELRYLGPTGEVWSFKTRPADLRQLPKNEWPNALTAMRQYVTQSSDARVVLGGKTLGYVGRMPGILEEVCISAAASQPLFVIGGFGGVARTIAQQVADSKTVPIPGSSDTCQVDQRNGLNEIELQRLAASPHIDEIALLLTRGLGRLFADSVA